MTHSSKGHVTPPRELPQVIRLLKEAYLLWLTLHRDFPKVERMGIGQKIEQAFLFVLEFSFASAYLPPEQKVVLLGRTITKLDGLKFFVQLAWESRLISTDKYSDLISRLGEIGRQLGGWRKGLQTKTPRS